MTTALDKVIEALPHEDTTPVAILTALRLLYRELRILQHKVDRMDREVES